ncbi:saccharopine dehydrogenase (NADP+, L-glutamate forming) [Colwellia chukchiensis]|uniref:Saccharopine dehydrogenase (NADP+, L-glutamate forming) n=1 Tax=Colwellia chukchiensis TaxID=641665 RepID=A0A1H7JR91_9GAMM|nr:saccharopine dehydrogenase family protein [Colwellia chukchiensis]SEK76846.1 saccharopine dehydrogenase (NADP+, L-glutamate forming) [Colwellia chukchiensis]
MTHTIHWLGAGLSSAPGIIELAKQSTPIIVWNRSLAKAQQLLKNDDIELDIRELDWAALANVVKPGDVLVSMLPATMHLTVAEFCLKQQAHFVSSSYIAPEMAALDAKAKAANLCFVNEVGLDPGIDHLFAHLLVDSYQASEQYSADNQLYFRSYCGGFPKVANDFKYKFSWSPLGVLKALRSKAQWQADGTVQNSNAPWEALSEYQAQLFDRQETFQAYPNRDSIPFIKQYNFQDNWDVQEFVRGTLRLNGWSTAWQGLFDEIASLEGSESEQRLQQISQELEQKYSYEDGEADRVVMCVELEVRRAGQVIWHQSYQLDSHGNAQGQAMARLVSYPVGLAITSVLNNEIAPGVSAAPEKPEQIHQWLSKLTGLGESIGHHDHIAR